MIFDLRSLGSGFVPPCAAGEVVDSDRPIIPTLFMSLEPLRLEFEKSCVCT